MLSLRYILDSPGHHASVQRDARTRRIRHGRWDSGNEKSPRDLMFVLAPPAVSVLGASYPATDRRELADDY